MNERNAEAKHTPEPWDVPPTYTACNGNRVSGGVFSTNDGLPDILIGEFHFRADALRAAACVSALAGIPDPQAFVDRAKRMEEALRRVKIEADGLVAVNCQCKRLPMHACPYCEIAFVVDEALALSPSHEEKGEPKT